LLAAGELKAPLADITSVYTNEFIKTWNAAK